VPHDFFLEPSRGGVMLDAADVHTHDTFESLQHRAGTNTFDWIGPLRSLSQIHCVVVTVGESESKRHSFGRLYSQRIDQLLAKKAHCRRAQDDDTLIVQPDDPFIRPEVEELGQMQILVID
jgi:hypothetical protein